MYGGNHDPLNKFDGKPGPGRPVGSPNKTTAEIRKCIQYIVEKQLDKLEDALDQVYRKDPARFLSLYERFCSFTLPKMQEISFNNDNGIDINATITELKKKLDTNDK